MAVKKITGYYNKNTGEVFEVDEIVARTEFVEDGVNYKRKKHGQDILFDMFGHFVFLHYGDLLSIDIHIKYLFRFIFLSTFINYKNNKLMKTERTPIKENDLKELLNLPKSEYSKTMKALREAGLICINDGEIFVKKQYVSKGKIKQRGKLSVDDEFSKIFIEGVRKLYSSVDNKEHKHIGIIFKLLPYVNKHFNIICKKEQVNYDVLEDIQPLKTSEIGRLLKLGRKKTLENLMSARLDNMPVFMGVVKETTKIDNIHYYVNPCVYYQGSAEYEEAIKFLCDMFKVKIS